MCLYTSIANRVNGYLSAPLAYLLRTGTKYYCLMPALNGHLKWGLAAVIQAVLQCK